MTHKKYPWQQEYGCFYFHMAGGKLWSLSSAKQYYTNSEGMAVCDLTGTGHTIQSLAEDPAIKDKWIKRAYDNGFDAARAEQADWNIYLVFRLGDALDTATDLTLKNGHFTHWGGWAGGIFGNVTLNLGEKDAGGARINGCTYQHMGWRSQSQTMGGGWTINMFDVNISDTSNIIDASQLGTSVLTTNDIKFGDDGNWNWSGTVNLEAFTLRSAAKLRKQSVGE